MVRFMIGAILGIGLLVLAILAFSLMGCFRKKAPKPKTLESELELLFPGQFEVLHTNLKMLDVMAQYKGEKRAVIGAKSDPEVQFFLDWQKGETSLGFDTASIVLLYERAKKEVDTARNWHSLLTEKGLKNCSVGTLGNTIFVQLFAEPTPEARIQILEILQSLRAQKMISAQNAFSVEFLEPTAYHQQYQDVIPAWNCRQDAGKKGEQWILALDLEAGSAINPRTLMREWEINIIAKRFNQVSQEAYKMANEWAEQKLPKPVFMSQDDYVTIEPLKQDPPAIQIAYPYYHQAWSAEQKLSNEPAGYVTGVYLLDQKIFTKIQNKKEI